MAGWAEVRPIRPTPPLRIDTAAGRAAWRAVLEQRSEHAFAEWRAGRMPDPSYQLRVRQLMHARRVLDAAEQSAGEGPA